MTSHTFEIESGLTDGAAATKSSIAQLLRRRIVAGELAPGTRLPTRSELEYQFGTTKATMQRAFDDLIEDGFITAEGRRGTFVSATPPHLTRFALVFSGRPNSGASWSEFYSSLCTEANRLAASAIRKFPFFYGVDQHHDAEDYDRLLREIRTNQLAGIVFTFNPEYVAHTPLMGPHGIPMAAIGDAPKLNLPTVGIDYRSFFDKALDEVVRLGRKRVAVVAPEMLFEAFEGHFRAGLRSRGLTSQPYWWQPLHLAGPQLARHQAHLLMHANQTVRPDALIIANDNFTDHVLLGLQDAGVRLPQDLEVIAHCNFPALAPAPAPLHRIGFDVRTILQGCLHGIGLQRQGKTAPSLTRVSAISEPPE